MVDICGCTKYNCRSWLCINLCCIILGFPIWAGLYFSAYEPYLSRDWKDTTCSIIDSQTYITFNTSWQVYIQYKALLTIDGEVFPAYGCESTASTFRPDDYSVDNVYPYKYTPCEEYHRGGDQCPDGLLFLPKWLCIPYEGTPAFTIGDQVECKWWFKGKYPGPDDADILDYPKNDGQYIEMIFTDEVNIPVNDYYALWVIPFGMMSVLPFLILTCWVGPSLYGHCDRDSFDNIKVFIDKIKDFIDIYIRCRKIIPRRFRRYPAPYFNDRFETLAPWVFAYEYSVAHKRKINDAMLKEICEYISGPYINPNILNS